jgi:predicted alpha/beta hydrolase
MAIGSNFYQPLVQALEIRGWHARTLPRRGFERDGERASRSHDWSYADEIGELAKAVEITRAQTPDSPVIVLGHSLGGQLVVGHQHLHDAADGVVTIGASLPDFRLYSRGGLGVLGLGMIVPASTALFGYHPKPLFGGAGAKTLMREWARMARGGPAPFPTSPRITTPSLIIQLEGDTYAVKRAGDAFASRLFARPTNWTYRRSMAPEGGTTHHIHWVRSPGPVADRIIQWWETQQ